MSHIVDQGLCLERMYRANLLAVQSFENGIIVYDSHDGYHGRICNSWDEVAEAVQALIQEPASWRLS